jgi:hypothetical protein
MTIVEFFSWDARKLVTGYPPLFLALECNTVTGTYDEKTSGKGRIFIVPPGG